MLDLERRQRLIGAVVIIAAFVLLFLLMSSRISRLLSRVSSLSRRAWTCPIPGAPPRQPVADPGRLDPRFRAGHARAMRCAGSTRPSCNRQKTAHGDHGCVARPGDHVNEPDRSSISTQPRRTPDYRHDEAAGGRSVSWWSHPNGARHSERLLYLVVVGRRAGLPAAHRDSGGRARWPDLSG